MKTFGQLLSEGRKKLHLRQEEVAWSIQKLDGGDISVTYLSDLEHDRRTPSEHLIAQFADVLQIPLDVLYFSLGKFPPDIRESLVSEEQIVAAMQALRQALTPLPDSQMEEWEPSALYPRAKVSAPSHRKFTVSKNPLTGLFERPNGSGSPPAA